MTTSNPSLMFALNTAAYRVWGQGVNTALAAVGLVQTADSGQVNWSTATWPAGQYASAGYEVWRFDDTLQSTKPVFIRLEYATPYYAYQNTPNIMVGTGTNGAGTLTGLTRGIFSTDQLPVSDGTVRSYFSSDKSSLCMCLVGSASGISTSPFWLTIDRTRDSDGTANGDGLYILRGCANDPVNTSAAILNFVATTQVSTNPSAFVPPFSSNYAGQMALYPHPVVIPKLEAPALACLSYWAGDIMRFSPVTVTHLGASHTYLCLGPVVQGVDVAKSASVSLAMRYE